MRRFLLFIFIILAGWGRQLSAQTPPADCNIQISEVVSDSSVYPGFELQWISDCFTSMDTVLVQESVGDDQNFATLDTVTGNSYTNIYDRQYGQTYFYRIYSLRENAYSAVASKTVSNEYALSARFSTFLEGVFPSTVNTNGSLNIQEAINATGSMDMPNQHHDWLDLDGIGYFINLDSIILDDNYVKEFPYLSRFLYQDGTPPFVSVNNTGLSFEDFTGDDGAKILSDFRYNNFLKERVRTRVQNNDIRNGLQVSGAPQFINPWEGDIVYAELYKHQKDGNIFHEDNLYHWYKDSVFLTTTTSETLTITSGASASDNGFYHCEITNPNFPGLTLKADGVLVLVGSDHDLLPATAPLSDTVANAYLKSYSQNQFYTSDGNLITSTLKVLKYINTDVVLSDAQKEALRDLSFLEEAYNVEEITITHTGAEIIPPLSGHTQLREVRLNDNNLTSMPSLKNYIALSLVNVSNNRLTFEDLYPLKDLEIRSLELFPQKAFTKDSLIQAAMGDTVTFDLGIASPLAGNIYEWFLNGVSVGTTAEARKVVSSVKPGDLGSYNCVITNPEFPAQTVSSGVYTLESESGPVPGIYWIKDKAFATWLRENFEGLMLNDSTDYLLVSKAAEIEDIHIGETDIKNLDGLQYFYFLREFTCNSKIQRVPDLSELTFLTTFAATNANLSFTHQLALNNLGLDSLVVENANFSFVPDNPVESPVKLRDASDNEVAWLYRLTSTAIFQNNSLMDMHGQSVFRWYKDEQVIREGYDSLNIGNFGGAHIGYYSASVTNPLFPGDTLVFDSVFVSIVNRPSWWAATPVTGITNNFYLAYPNSEYLDTTLVSPGDIIGVFYEDETSSMQTRSTGIWTGERMIFSGTVLPGDVDGIDPKTGFEENELLQFKLYDVETLKEYDVAPQFAPSGEEWPLFHSVYPYELEDVIDFYSDSLFHPIVFDSVLNTHLKMNWSVIVNWTVTGAEPWEPVTGGPENHVVLIPQNVYSDIRGTSLENGDYLGFFFESETGEMICSDLAKWTGESVTLSPWGSNDSPKNGFNEGEPLRLKIRKKSTQEEYFADVVVYDSRFNADGVYIASGLSIIDSITVVTPCAPQDIALYPGWNLISSNVIPEDTSMTAVFAEVDTVVVKNAAGNIVYAPQNGISGSAWNYKEGYQVFVVENTILSLCGSPVADKTTIDIPQNTYPYLFPYWYAEPGTVSEVLGSIESYFDYAQSVEYDEGSMRFSARNYIPSHIIDPPIDNIGTMKPSLAYKLRMNASATYTYETGTGARQGQNARHAAIASTQYFDDLVQESGQNSVLVIPAASLPASLVAGDEIAVMGKNETLAGAGVFNGDNLVITIWESKSMRNGDPLSLKVWQHEHNREVVTSVTYARGSGTFEKNSLQVLAGMKLPEEPLFSGDIIAYPNPASDQVFIRVPAANESSVMVKVYDLMGNQLIDQEFSSFEGNKREITLDTSSLAGGSYLLQIVCADHLFQNKLVVVK